MSIPDATDLVRQVRDGLRETSHSDLHAKAERAFTLLNVAEAGWRDMATVPKDGTPMLLLDPGGFVGIGFIETRTWPDEPEREPIVSVSGSAAWIGTQKHHTTIGVWLGGYKPMDAIAWQPLPVPPAPSDSIASKGRT